jgi:L-arabinose isomerase
MTILLHLIECMDKNKQALFIIKISTYLLKPHFKQMKQDTKTIVNNSNNNCSLFI